MSNPKIIWSGIYLGINCIALIIILLKGELLGDLLTVPLVSYANPILSLVLIALVIVLLLYINRAAMKITVPSIPAFVMGRGMSVFIGLLILAFILFVNYTGLFVAGSSVRGGDGLSAFFVIFNPDVLFLIYYASRRRRGYSKLVLLLWAISSIQRGWFGFIFPLIAIESFVAIRARSIKKKHIAILLTLLPFFPLYDLAKVYIRVSNDFSIENVVRFVVAGLESQEVSISTLIVASVEKIVGRLQVISHSTYILENANTFKLYSASGEMVPFWKEGIFGIALDRIFGNGHRLELPQVFARVLVPKLESAWNVNPSITGWIVAYSDYFVLPIIYAICLAIFLVCIGKMVSRDRVFGDFIFFILLTMIVPGWIAQLISFLIGLIIYSVFSLVFYGGGILFKLPRISKRSPVQKTASRPPRPMAVVGAITCSTLLKNSVRQARSMTTKSCC